MDDVLPSIRKLDSNFYVLHLPTHKLDIYYSYDTIIAYRFDDELIVSENKWSVTTGRHLNTICRDKKKRIPHAQVLNGLEMLLKDIYYGGLYGRRSYQINKKI